MRKLQGIAVSPGVAIGEALVMDNEGFRIPRRFVARDAVVDELERLDKAVAAAAAEIAHHRETVSAELGEKYGGIFEAHLQMLQDAKLRSEVEEMIRQRHYSPEYAVSRVLRRYAQVFQRLESSYLAERASDIFDIEKRLLRHLLGRRREGIAHLTSPVLVLAHNLTPSETANLDRRFVRGFVTEVGGPGSHTAIVAEALEIPAVVGTGAFLTDVSGGELTIIDGDKGLVILQPDEETLGPLPPRGRGTADPGHQAGAAPRSARRNPRRRPHPTAGQHRVPLRGRSLRRPRGGRRGTVPHRVPLPRRRQRADRGGPFPGLLPRGPGDGAEAGGDPHVRPGGGQDAQHAADGGRAQPVPRPAEHPPGAAQPAGVPHAVAGDPAGHAAGQNPHHVPPGLHAAGTAAGENGPGRRDGRPPGAQPPLRPRRPGGHDGGNARRRDDGRPLRRGGRFPQPGHQRPDPIHAWPWTAATRTWWACTTPPIRPC